MKTLYFRDEEEQGYAWVGVAFIEYSSMTKVIQKLTLCNTPNAINAM